KPMGQGLENVRKIYLEGIAGGNAREAVYAYTGHRYTQHSTGVGDGAEGFLTFFEPFVERNPKRDIEIVRIFEDGPWVFCSAYQSLNDGAAQWVTMDMFYTDADGLILEHWDTIAAYEEKTVAGEDMVGGAKEVDLSAPTEANKALVLEYTKQVRQEAGVEKISQFVAEDLVEHSPPIAAGRDGLAAWLGSEDAGSYEMLFQHLGQGDFVVTYGKRNVRGKDVAVFDLYRVADDKIVEHWMNEEEVSPRENWGNSGKF
ncbi:MAG: nuclear transport factor 2 family protein, partial [Pseudomonadota bacterium]